MLLPMLEDVLSTSPLTARTLVSAQQQSDSFLNHVTATQHCIKECVGRAREYCEVQQKLAETIEDAADTLGEYSEPLVQVSTL